MEYSKDLRSSIGRFRKVILLSILALLTTAILIGVMIYINGQGSRRAITEAEIKKEKAFIAQYHENETKYENEFGQLAQPVKKDEIEYIQNELIQRAKSYQLAVNSVTRISSSAQSKPNNANSKASAAAAPAPTMAGIEYEINFTGPWESSVRYIRDMQVGSGLLSIRSLNMKHSSTSDLLVETAIRYKIYLEEG